MTGGVATASSVAERSLSTECVGLSADESSRATWKALSLSLPVGLLYALSVPATPDPRVDAGFPFISRDY